MEIDSLRHTVVMLVVHGVLQQLLVINIGLVAWAIHLPGSCLYSVARLPAQAKLKFKHRLVDGLKISLSQ